MARKMNKTGRDPIDHFAPLSRRLLLSPAWQDLSLAAKAIYPYLKLEWRGPNNNNNGEIRLSNRQAAAMAGIAINTATRAFHDLQAKGFLVITEYGTLGFSGQAKSPSYEITELPLPNSDQRGGRRLFDKWCKGKDYPVHKHHANNPSGRNGKNKIPSPKQRQSNPQKGDVLGFPVTKLGMA
jgi:hypothetical protein